MLSVDLSVSVASPVVEDFIDKGVHRFEQTLDAEACGDLLADLKADRAWGADLFLEEEAFDASHFIDPKGRPFGNVCLGCDAFFEAILGEDIKKIREKRLALRAS